MHLTSILTFFLQLHFFSVVMSVKLRSDFALNHPYHSPTEIHQSPCIIPEKFHNCWVKTTKKDSWIGIKTLTSSVDKFILLKPIPQGSFNFARRVCEACDLEVAEIWDEHDLQQFLNAIDENDTFSYWIGAFLNKKQTNNFRWTYQDGKTFLGFKEGIEDNPEGDQSQSQQDSDTIIIDNRRHCLTLEKTGDFSTWRSVPCLFTNQSVICQYKRKYDCYENEDQPSLTLMRDGHYLSSKGQPWALASHTCANQGKTVLSLLYFHPKYISKITSLLTQYLPIHRHNPATTEIWTGARFEGDKLFWHLNPPYQDQGDTKLEMQPTEWKQLPWSEQQEQENKPCVYVKLNKDKELHLFRGDCERDKFFICKTLEDNNEPVIRYCENDTVIERKSSRCKWNWIFNKKSDCICFKGAHGLTSHTTCNTRLLLSTKTRCIKLSSFRKNSILHWKPIPEIDLHSGEPFLLFQNRAQRGHKFIQWISMTPGSKRQIFGDANIYFKGLFVTLLSSFSQGSLVYCFEWVMDGAEGEVVDENSYNEIRIRNESFWLIFNDIDESCEYTEAMTNKSEMVKVKKHLDFSKVKDECDLKCNRQKKSHSKKHINSTKSTPHITNLNSEMLKHMVDSMFYEDYSKEKGSSSHSSEPRLLLLDKFFDITQKICSCMVPSTFLDNALEFFKIAYRTGNYEYVQDFKKYELEQIGNMLSTCTERSEDKAIVCERNECSGRALKTTGLFNGGGLKTTPLDDTGYTSNPYHHLIEVVWHVVEIWNVACIREFKESYLLYHDLEQVMEKLFLGEIRELWYNPSLYHHHLLGPNEEVHMSNLKNCVDAVYESNPKVLKLTRPKSISSNSLGKQIRNRKKNQEFLHDHLSNTSTIFCSKDQFCLD